MLDNLQMDLLHLLISVYCDIKSLGNMRATCKSLQKEIDDHVKSVVPEDILEKIRTEYKDNDFLLLFHRSEVTLNLNIKGWKRLPYLHDRIW